MARQFGNMTDTDDAKFAKVQLVEWEKDIVWDSEPCSSVDTVALGETEGMFFNLTSREIVSLSKKSFRHRTIAGI